MFEELDIDDEDKGADLAFEEGSDSGDNFNANELLNLSDYKNKRQQEENKPKVPLKPRTEKNVSVKEIFEKQKKGELNKESEDDGWELDEDDWGGA